MVNKHGLPFSLYAVALLLILQLGVRLTMSGTALVLPPMMVIFVIDHAFLLSLLIVLFACFELIRRPGWVTCTVALTALLVLLHPVFSSAQSRCILCGSQLPQSVSKPPSPHHPSRALDSFMRHKP